MRIICDNNYFQGFILEMCWLYCFFLNIFVDMYNTMDSGGLIHDLSWGLVLAI